jgi:hypothetical protein
MPEKYKEITIRIVSAPYIAGNDAYCNVQMWGNPNDWVYRMKLGKTLWFSIYDHLLKIDNCRFSEELEPSVLQENLEYLNGRIITIRAVSDLNVSFKTKDGKTEYGKKFVADFRRDLEEADREGGEVLKKAMFDTIYDNIAGAECIVINSKLAKLTIQLEKEKLEEKEMKKRQKKLIDFEKSEVEWVKRKREEKEKDDEKQKKLGNYAGW